MSYNAPSDHIEWHMHQLRQWMVPTSVPMPPKPGPTSAAQTFPQEYYLQNVPSRDMYDYTAFNNNNNNSNTNTNNLSFYFQRKIQD